MVFTFSVDGKKKSGLTGFLVLLESIIFSYTPVLSVLLETP